MSQLIRIKYCIVHPLDPSLKMNQIRFCRGSTRIPLMTLLRLPIWLGRATPLVIPLDAYDVRSLQLYASSYRYFSNFKQLPIRLMWKVFYK